MDIYIMANTKKIREADLADYSSQKINRKTMWKVTGKMTISQQE